MELARIAAEYGVATHYEPAPGRRIEVPEATVRAVLAAMGADPARTAPAPPPLLPPTVLRLPQLPEGTRLELRAETGEELDPAGELPYGCHSLYAAAPDGRTARATLVTAPPGLPRPPRAYGLMLQPYALLSTRSWGMGDLGDLAELAAWSGRVHGAGFLQLGPLHAGVPAAPGAPADPSPYRPSSRRFPDPVHLRVEDVPEYRHLALEDRAALTPLLARAAALRQGVLEKGALIDRDAVWALKYEALQYVRRVPLAPGRRAAYHDFLAERGQPLEDHATWCVLAEEYGPDWRTWPARLRDPRSAAVRRARAERLDRVDLHAWLVWLTEEQLARAQRLARAAGMPIGLVHDLAVGVHPGGSDAWALRDHLAAGMSIGAPPDAFNARGQDWGLPPWRPDALAADGYGPYREVLRGLLRHAGALRIDHVMGLSRLWWVPRGRPPAEGTYVRYDARAMLAVLAVEAWRAGAPVIGEDLGTVEPAFRTELAERGVLGTSVLWFERDWDAAGPARPLPPERWREACLATATTHDLPPTAARLRGSHVELRHRLGLLDAPLEQARRADAAETGEWLELLRELGLLPEGPYGEEAAVRAVHRLLARTPARLVGVWLPDAAGDVRPANVPGTTDTHPNWRLPLSAPDGHPLTLEALAATPRVHALLTEVRRAIQDDT
ncbi:4-alpha-glucanotransferase [Streptomyces polyrhachis]|uniref:4-alpha-glucanotransferase n=1 Tax=Streptomyces polyrhachis TaxID=1282885 RepID=A0ABW2GHW0_9ACTN